MRSTKSRPYGPAFCVWPVAHYATLERTEERYTFPMDVSPEGQFRQPEHAHAYERVVGSGQDIIPLTDFKGLMRAQVLLASAAFPKEQAPLEAWVKEDASGDSLASRFRAYVEDPARTPEEMQLDQSRIAEFLDSVRTHPPETVH
jgi:hypothetical protein